MSTEEYHDMTGSTIGKMSYQGQGKCPMWKFKRLEVTLKYNENSTFNIIGNIKKGYFMSWGATLYIQTRSADLSCMALSGPLQTRTSGNQTSRDHLNNHSRQWP